MDCMLWTLSIGTFMSLLVGLHLVSSADPNNWTFNELFGSGGADKMRVYWCQCRVLLVAFSSLGNRGGMDWAKCDLPAFLGRQALWGVK